jgi:2-polyprenyl-6-methoxyphenol hydroxylase-like FAD-dependent oxidoreductase
MHHRRAYVLGGGFCGSLAALALADRGYDVVLCETRGALPGDEHGRGVAQASHVHLLNKRGLDVLEEYWPSIRQSMNHRNFAAVDVDRGVHWLNAAYARLGPPNTQLGSLQFFHRASLDEVVSRAVRQHGRIDVYLYTTFLRKCTHNTHGSARVTSLWVRDQDGPKEILVGDNDLVVDATGRFSMMDGVADVHHVPSRFWYRSFEVEADLSVVHADAQALLVTTLGMVRSHGFVMSPIDVGAQRYLLTQVAEDFGSDDSVASVRHFFDRFTGAPRTLTKLFDTLVPRTPPRRFKLEGSTRLTAAALAGMPCNWFVVGDRIARLNPVFGQGLGVGAEVVAMLMQHIDGGTPHAPHWAKQVEPLLRRAYFFSSIEDKLHAWATHPRWSWCSRWLVTQATAWFFACMQRSAWLHRIFLRRANMLDERVHGTSEA